jgi:hypothetical protein
VGAVNNTADVKVATTAWSAPAQPEAFLGYRQQYCSLDGNDQPLRGGGPVKVETAHRASQTLHVKVVSAAPWRTRARRPRAHLKVPRHAVIKRGVDRVSAFRPGHSSSGIHARKPILVGSVPSTFSMGKSFRDMPPMYPGSGWSLSKAKCPISGISLVQWCLTHPKNCSRGKTGNPRSVLPCDWHVAGSAAEAAKLCSPLHLPPTALGETPRSNRS